MSVRHRAGSRSAIWEKPAGGWRKDDRGRPAERPGGSVGKASCCASSMMKTRITDGTTAAALSGYSPRSGVSKTRHPERSFRGGEGGAERSRRTSNILRLFDRPTASRVPLSGRSKGRRILEVLRLRCGRKTPCAALRMTGLYDALRALRLRLRCGRARPRERCRRYALPPHSKNQQVSRIARASARELRGPSLANCQIARPSAQKKAPRFRGAHHETNWIWQPLAQCISSTARARLISRLILR